ncbi:GNAT family N-acetyltransferase [Microbacterium sp. ZXX196]|uniref:GNAT family N-acetyltransferase n=1 Tax=Microbacterium sp. ZXX196 TaxID=2609291 RepID=UPI001324DB08|nr:GNAT family N-acetyltransferase [Microbacterium sp. ZXX196]
MTGERSFRPSTSADAAWIAELRAVVLRPDLERLGRYDATRVRRRFLDAFVPAHTRVIQVAGADVGVVAVRPDEDVVWIEHFYLDPAEQGQGAGGWALAQVLAMDTAGRPFRLNVLQGSRARRLYERYGFVLASEDSVDVYLTRPAPGEPPAGSATQTEEHL